MRKTSEIRDALQAILRRNHKRKLLPSAVVEAARDPDSPLHHRFTWDDSKAAHEYRLWQARELIVSVEIVVDNRFESSPVYVSLQSDRLQGGYRALSDVLSDKALRAELLTTAAKELEAFQWRYDRFAELSGVFREARRFKRHIASNGKVKTK
jgi:hypothetical protein